MPDTGERRRNPGRPRSCATQEDDVRPVTSTSVRTARSRSDPPAQRGERPRHDETRCPAARLRSQRTQVPQAVQVLSKSASHGHARQYHAGTRCPTDALSAPVAMFSIQSSDLCPTAAAQLDRAVAHGRDRGSAGVHAHNHCLSTAQPVSQRWCGPRRGGAVLLSMSPFLRRPLACSREPVRRTSPSRSLAAGVNTIRQAVSPRSGIVGPWPRSEAAGAELGSINIATRVAPIRRTASAHQVCGSWSHADTVSPSMVWAGCITLNARSRSGSG